MAGDGTEGGTLPPRSGRRGRWRGEGAEVLRTLAGALVLALLVRWLLMEGFIVSGLSMVPTLHDGDRLLVNKLVYHLRQPARGEIVVFAYPKDPKRDFIKRVVAVAGETVEVRGGQVYIGGQLLDEPYIRDFGGPDLPPYTVPAGSVWVMGDNRPYSDDSRVFGPVDRSLLWGRTFYRYWPLKSARSFP